MQITINKVSQTDIFDIIFKKFNDTEERFAEMNKTKLLT